MLGWSAGTNRLGDPRLPHLRPSRGWGQVCHPGSHHGKSTLPTLHPPAPDVPSSPRGKHTWLLLGSRWRGHSPACPACQALRGHQGGLCVPVGEEEDCEHAWAEQQGQGSVLKAMSPGPTLPMTSHPGVPAGDTVGLSIPQPRGHVMGLPARFNLPGFATAWLGVQHGLSLPRSWQELGSRREPPPWHFCPQSMHVPMLPGDQSSSPASCVSRLGEAPLLRHSVPEVTVPVCPLAVPLPSAPAVPGGPWDLVGS